MTLDEAKRLSYGDTVDFISTNGTLRHCKVNGKPQTWKRDANRIRVPVKYGLYEYAAFELMTDGTIGNYSGVTLVKRLI